MDTFCHRFRRLLLPFQATFVAENGYFLSPFSATFVAVFGDKLRILFVSVFGDFCRQCGQALIEFVT